MSTPRINHAGCYTDANTVDLDGNLLPYTPEQFDRTKAFEEANGIPSTLPDETDSDDTSTDETDAE